MLAGMIARPRATSSRTNSGVIDCRESPRRSSGPRCWRVHDRRQRAQHLVALQVLADRDELHLGRDDAAARVVHLRDVRARLGAARLALQVEAQAGELRDRRAARGRSADVGPSSSSVSPRSAIHARAQRGQARADVDRRRRDRCTGPRCRRRRSADSSPRRTMPACRDCAISRIGTRMSAREPST